MAVNAARWVRSGLAALGRYRYMAGTRARTLGWRALSRLYRRSPDGVIPVEAWMQPRWLRYRGYAGPWIEHYFDIRWRRAADRRKARDWIYIPVHWTDIYAKHNVRRGREEARAAMAKEQQALERWLAGHLDPSKKYFTIVQYGNGTGIRTPGNVVTFAAGGAGDVPIPLLKPERFRRDRTRDIDVSFMGRWTGASDRTGVRSKMFDALQGRAGYYFGGGTFFEFKDVLERSNFTLCPRGFGRTSFRLYEALAARTIPIYIWDDLEWLPYRDELDWSTFAISINVRELHALPEIVRGHTRADIARKRAEIDRVYERYFTMTGTANYILRVLGDAATPESLRARGRHSPGSAADPLAAERAGARSFARTLERRTGTAA